MEGVDHEYLPPELEPPNPVPVPKPGFWLFCAPKPNPPNDMFNYFSDYGVIRSDADNRRYGRSFVGNERRKSLRTKTNRDASNGVERKVASQAEVSENSTRKEGKKGIK